MDPIAQSLIGRLADEMVVSNPGVAQQLRNWLRTGSPPMDPQVLALVRQAAQQRGVPEALVLPGTDKIPGGRPQNAQGPGDAPGEPPPTTPIQPNSTDPNDGPAPTIPPTTPTTPPVPTPDPLGTADPNYGQNSGLDIYNSAARGQSDAQDIVLMNILDSLGIDYARPGMFTNEIIAQIKPFLPLYMMMMSAQQPGSAGARGAANQFRDIVNSPNAFAKIQAWVNDPANQETIKNYIANAANQDTAVGAINAVAQAASAGMSPMQQQTDASLLGQQYKHFVSATGNNPNLHYLDWLNQQQPGSVPKQLLPFLNGKVQVQRPLVTTP